jgi:hypothetical protein
MNSSGSSIPAISRLGVMLRWLAGGSYLDLCFAWGISTSTFYHENGVLWPAVEALDRDFSFHLVMRAGWRSLLRGSGSIQVEF